MALRRVLAAEQRPDSEKEVTMSASKPSSRGIFYPDEIEEMRDEVARGNLPGETAAEREARALEILERNRSRGEPLEFSDETQSPRPFTDTERHA